MRKSCLLMLLASMIAAVSYAQQISINDSYSEDQLVEDFLIQGCVEISNVQSNLNGSSIGINSLAYFEKADSNFPFNYGIMLSTGMATSGGNVANASPLNEGDINWGADADLENALGIANTLNATSIEFDFISVSNLVQFNYILASEEYYADYPCEYSDGFAFLIKESGTAAPYSNIALIPGSNTPVNTSTIHEEIVGFCEAENPQYFDGYNLGDTNFNGRTTVLTASASIQPNVQYHIKLVIADQNDENFDSAVFIEGNSFSANVDLGSDITTCADQTTINAETDNNLATYTWLRNGLLLGGETSSELTVTSSGDYTVIASMPIANSTCTIEDTITVTLNSTQPAGEISDFELCDDASSDGVEIFDLTLKEDDVLDAVPNSNYNITYYYTSTDAENNTNSISGSISNTANPQQIFVRIEDLNNGCLAYTSFNLVVNPLPEIIQPADIYLCSSSETADIDLAGLSDELTDSNENLVVTYHITPGEAENGINAITLPYETINSTETIFIRIKDLSTGCYNTSLINIFIQDSPVISSQQQSINACEQDGDGFETFDLTSVEANILEGLTGVTVTYHTTYEDAQTGANPISNPWNYENEVQDEQDIYIRVVDDVTGCFSIGSTVIYANILNSGTNTNDYNVCDDDSNDGVAEVDLQDVASTVTNGMDGMTVIFYETENDQDNDINSINQSIPYEISSSPFTIYVTIIKEDCYFYTDMNLIVSPAVILETPDPVDYCDDDDDGFASIHLPSFNSHVTGGTVGFQIRYYLTEEDAENTQNQLPWYYTNTTSTQLVYARVRNNAGCYDIVPLTINVIPAPTVSEATDIVICDDDYDGFYNINLDDKIDEIVTSTDNLTITFHTSEDDANSDENAISSTTNYSSPTQQIYVRVESDITGCLALVSFQVTVNTLPQFPEITNFQNCETDGNEIADFYFIDKDSEILNGQTGKQVLYFESENDALNRTNIIDKTTAYQNLSNPQTIYVRVENLTDESCFGVSSFTIEVGSIPLFNLPTDKYVCDDISNDTHEEFNLQEIVDEVTSGMTDNLTVTFYETLEDAENFENPLPMLYTNQQNPQQVYARIDNDTYCYGIAEFGLNVIQAPEVNLASDYIQCDDDYDGITTFDLNVTLDEVLTVRQDDLIISYFENLDDLENNTNAISNPENYNNISNPQTVYIKLTNPTSSCFVTVPLELVVNLPPTLGTTEVSICDNSSAEFNLNDASYELIGDQDNIQLTYYANLNDAQNSSNPMSGIINYSSNNTSIFVFAENTVTGCSIIGSFNLHVNPLPEAYQPNDLEECDDDFDGMLYFNLNQQTATILGGQNENNFSVNYYEILQEAMNDTNAITDLNYNAFDDQTIYARVTNNSTGCFSLTSFNIYVHRLPIIDIPDQTICLNNLPLVVSASTGFNSDSYSWSTNQNSSEIEITQPGTYSVTVTTDFGCSSTSTFNVIESEQAMIEFTETTDFSNPNNITVTINGIGNYLYVLDGGQPQETNVFYNVSWGIHTVEIIDLNGCASAIKEITVIDAPTFFTPNNDGDNDIWQIAGIDQLEGTLVYIFDRFGKQLAVLSSNSEGWDGTYRGELMPSNDYWFLAKVKKGDEQFEVKNHFTLKR